MPFKRKDSPFWQIRKYNLPGYGDTGAISTGAKDKAVAMRMESLLVDIANKALIDVSWKKLLDAICNHEVSLADALAAHNMGRLDAMKRGLSDPLIGEVIAEFRRLQSYDKRVATGLERLEEFASERRMSWLTARRIVELCIRCETEYKIKRNSVHRQLKQAISQILRFQLGNAERNRIFADVSYSKENDTREVHLTPRDIAALLQACDDTGFPEFKALIQIALLTSADRGTLLHGKSAAAKELDGLWVRDITIVHDSVTGRYEGEVFIRGDEKTKTRKRTVPIPHHLCEELLILCRDKGPNETVFSFKYQQMDYRWNKIRKAAGFWNEEDKWLVTFKDLRAQTSIYGEEAGIPQTVIMRTMGHNNEAMTMRYQQRRAAMSQEQAEALAAKMFGVQASTNTGTNSG